MTKIISISKQKGGVGKTTTAASLSAGLFALGQKVLSIDLDPQGDLGFCLGLESDSPVTLYDVLTKKCPAQSAIQSTEYGDVIPSDISLESVVVEFAKGGCEAYLKDVLGPVIDSYDYIIIDTPPALNILTVNCYVASDYIIIPMLAEILSLSGVIKIRETIQAVQESFNPRLKVLGILMTRNITRLNLSKEVEEMASDLSALFNTRIFTTRIRNGVSTAECPAHGKPVQFYAPRSNPGKDYTAFVQEVFTILK